MEIAELIKQMLEKDGIRNFGVFGLEGPYSKVKKALLGRDWSRLSEEMAVVINICASIAYEQAACNWLTSVASFPWTKEGIEEAAIDGGCKCSSGSLIKFAPTLPNVVNFLNELEKKFELHPEYKKRASIAIGKIMADEKVRPIVKAFIRAELPSL